METFGDYEDLKIAVGYGTAIGRYAVGVETDARTYEDEEYGGYAIDELIYASNTTIVT